MMGSWYQPASGLDPKCGDKVWKQSLFEIFGVSGYKLPKRQVIILICI